MQRAHAHAHHAGHRPLYHLPICPPHRHPGVPSLGEGLCEDPKIVTCIVTLAKRVIYESRLNETYASFSHLINRLKLEIEVKRQAARQAYK